MAETPDYLMPRQPDGQTDPLDGYFQSIRTESLRRLPDPEAAARGSAVARTFGISPSLADDHLSELEQQDRVNRAAALQRKHPAVARWADQNPRGMASAADDEPSLDKLSGAFLTRTARDRQDFLTDSGFLDRMGDLLKAGLYGLQADAATVRGALQDWSARNPLPWTSAENVADARRKASQARAIARIYRDTSGSVSGETSAADLFNKPSVGTTARFVGDQMARSLPGMAQAALAAPLYVVGLAGNIGQTRAEVQGREDATVTDITEAAPAAILSAAMERLGIHGIFGTTGGTAIRRVGQAAATEAATEFGQSAVEYIGGHSQTGTQFDIDEMLRQSAAGAIAGAGMGGSMRSTVETSSVALRPVRSLVRRFADADAGLRGADFLDAVGDAAAQSKLKARDQESFAGLIREMASDAGADSIFIPTEAVQAYMQSDAYDGSFDRWSEQIDDALVTGGDFVLPVETAIAEIAGTPAWEALKEDMRLSPGGMSRREAQTFDEAMADVMADLSDKMETDDRATRAAQAPRDRLFTSLTDKLMEAGFTPTMARQQAELLAQRAATRAGRMGRDLTGQEYDGLEVRQVLPANVAAAQRADQLDVTISVMQGNRDPAQKLGPSLMDYIAKGGGIIDTGGDLKAMGADAWHRGKPGKRKLLRVDDSAQESMLAGGGLGVNEYGADAWAMRAWEAGFFPDFADRPTANDLLDAIAEGVAGRDRHLVAREKSLRDAAEELRALLENRGVDPDTATRQEIRAAVDAYVAQQAEGDGYDQSSTSPVATLQGDEIAPEGTMPADFRKAARAWFNANLRGKIVNNPAVGDIEFSKAGVNKAISSSANLNKLKIFPALPALIENGRVVSEEPVADATAKPNVRRYIWLEGHVSLAGESHRVRVNLEERTDGRIYYNHTLPDQYYFQEARSDDPSKAGGSDIEAGSLDPDGRSSPADRRSDPDIARPADNLNLTFNAGEKQPRGRISFPGGKSASAIIELFQGRDQSTFLHETGHLWLEELREDAADPNAPQQVRDDWQMVQEWFAADGHPIVDGVIPVEAHELWARGVERYLMEGKAPSPGLRRAFQTFKAWLVSLYNSVSRLRSPISDDIRGVMDRLIASDEELADAVAAQHIEALFPDKPAAMSAGEFAAYQRIATEARDAAHDRMLAKTMNAIKRRVTQQYREQEGPIRADVTDRVNALPEFRALRLLRDSPIDSQWVRDHFGEDAPAMLPRQVPPVHKPGGANPDEIAEMSGFTSGDEMVRTLMGVEIRRREMKEAGDNRSVRTAMIEQEVGQTMLDRYGDPFSDGSIQEEALAAVHSDQQGEVLAAELRVLARSTGDRPTPYRVARDWAARQVREGKVNDVASRSSIVRYERAVAKAGRAAMEAVIAGNGVEAFRQKQAQMLNNALVAEARRAADDVDAAVGRLEKWAKRRTIASVDQDYLERAQLLLEQVEMKPRTQRSLARQESFETWAAAREAEGYDVIVPPSFAESLGKTHWSRLSVEMLLGLDAAVKQIIHLGRLKQTLIDNKAERDFAAVRAEALLAMEQMPTKPLLKDFREPGYLDRAKTMVLGLDASMLKAETILDWLDDGKPGGVFNRVVFQPLADAQERQRLLLKDVYAKLEAALETVPKAQVKRWADKVTLNFIDPETGRQAVMTRDQLIAMALNMGNEGNARKLAEGYGWGEQSIAQMLNERLTKEEWVYVQQVWDIIDALWPDIAALERRVNGVEPDKVEARELVTSAGLLRGGYYPLVYDPRRSLKAETHGGQDANKLFESAYRRATTRAGSTNERVDVKRPVLLSLSVISRHVGEVVHDITHREAVMQGYKFVNDPMIVRRIDETLGPEMRRQINPWLQHVANEWAHDAVGAAALEKAVKALRANATFVGMAYRWSTMVMQGAGLFNAAERIGGRWVAEGVYRFSRHPVETMKFVLEKSQEVTSRMDTMDRDVRDAIKRAQSASGAISNIKLFGFWGIGLADRFVATVTWIGAYNRGLNDRLDETAAIAFADKAVRQSQGSGSAKDLAAIQRGRGNAGEAAKLLTMFYSYMSAFYQRQRTLGRDYGRAISSGSVKDFPGLLSRTMLLYFFPAIVSELLAGRGPDDDDEWAAWAIRTVGLSALGPLPVIRDVAGGIASGFGYNFSPASGLGRTAVNIWKDGKNLWEGEETKRATRDVMEMAGYLGAPVSGQMAASTQFLVDVAHGDADPQTFGDWWEGLKKGKLEEK